MEQRKEILLITASAPMRLESIVLASCVILFIVYVLTRHPEKFFVLNPPAVISTVLVSLVVLFMLGIISRNVFGKENLSIVKNATEVAAGEISCPDLIRISTRARPVAYSAEAKMEALGIGGGQIIFVTTSGSFSFGSGLSDVEAIRIIEKIERFCGRRLFVSS